MDTITIIDGHVLLPDRHNWRDGGPTWKLSYTTHEEAALRGNEGRSALRRFPRPRLTFAIWPSDLQSAARHQARVRRGLALGGRFCCPHHGRETWLTTAAGPNSAQIALAPGAWHWVANAWLMLWDPDGENRSVHQVSAVAGDTLTILPPLPVAYPADTAVYPLFFGRRESSEADELWSPDLPISRLELVGDSFAIDPDLVPSACRTADLSDIDFAVVRFSWLPTSGEDCDIHVGISDPMVAGNVGYGSGGGLVVPPYPSAPWLSWSQEATADRYEEVLVDLRAIAAAYPAAATITIRLQARWFGVRADGKVALRFSTWRGGTMQGPTDHQYSNVGGQVRQVLTRNVNVPGGPGDIAYYSVGTLVYTVATKSAVILPP